MILSAKDFPGSAGHVTEMKWTPDGCAIILSWSKGGISLWSTFGTMLMCSLGWDYGLQVDLPKQNPLDILSMDWSTDGYQLFMVRKQRPQQQPQCNLDNSNNDIPLGNNNNNNSNITPKLPKKQILVHTHSNSSTQSVESNPTSDDTNFITSLIQLDFVKSVLAVNPCMVC